MNLTKKQIDVIVEKTPKSLKGKSMSLYSVLGYFRPYGANWSYCAGYVKHNGFWVVVVTVFGQVQ